MLTFKQYLAHRQTLRSAPAFRNRRYRVEGIDSGELGLYVRYSRRSVIPNPIRSTMLEINGDAALKVTLHLAIIAYGGWIRWRTICFQAAKSRAYNFVLDIPAYRWRLAGAYRRHVEGRRVRSSSLSTLTVGGLITQVAQATSRPRFRVAARRLLSAHPHLFIDQDREKSFEVTSGRSWNNCWHQAILPALTDVLGTWSAGEIGNRLQGRITLFCRCIAGAIHLFPGGYVSGKSLLLARVRGVSPAFGEQDISSSRQHHVGYRICSPRSFP